MSQRRPPFALLMAITATGILANPIVTPSIPEILDGVGASTAGAGLFVAGATLPGVLLAPVIGLLADRFGRREVLIPCLVLFGVAGGAAAFAPSLAVLVALRFLQGAGSSGLINLAVVIIGDHWTGTERARRIGRNSAVITVSLAVLPAFGGLLTDLGGWQAPFFVYPVSLLTAVGVARLLPRATRRAGTVADQITEALPILTERRMRAVLACGVVTFALIFAVKLTVLPIYLEAAFGLSATARGLILGLPSLGATGVALALGGLTARLGRRRLLLVGGTAMAGALGILVLADTIPGVLVAVVLFGLGEGVLIPSLQDIAAGAAPTSARGAVVAVMVATARLGQTIGPLGVASVLAAGGAVAAFGVGGGVAAVLLIPLLIAATRRNAAGQSVGPDDLEPPPPRIPTEM